MRMRRIMTDWVKKQRGRRNGVEPPIVAKADGIFRRFFDLIERMERTPPKLETKSEPERKLRVTRLDDDAVRRP
ncbi:MAG: hypothetical protein ACRDBL_11535 [Rhabdaerophilum sp.]